MQGNRTEGRSCEVPSSLAMLASMKLRTALPLVPHQLLRMLVSQRVSVALKLEWSLKPGHLVRLPQGVSEEEM